LNKTWGEYENIKNINIIHLDDDDDIPEDVVDPPDTQMQITPPDTTAGDQLDLPANPEIEVDPDLGGTIPRISGLQRELFKINTSYNQTVMHDTGSTYSDGINDCYR
jgi:hypothetical protein